MKVCRGCNLEQEETNFILRKDRSNRLRPYCNTCRNQEQKTRYTVYKQTSPFKHKCSRAKTRAKNLNIAFDLTPEYLESIWTGFCPVFKDKIHLYEVSRLDEFAAELDRFVPEKGYIKGNVHFLSRRANRLKNNVTTKELQQLIDWMKQHENS